MVAELLRRAWRSFISFLERSLARPYTPALTMGELPPGQVRHKKPEVAYAPPSRRLVYATALCLIALLALSAALLVCVVLTGEAPGELTTSIVALASTLAGIYLGRKGDVSPKRAC